MLQGFSLQGGFIRPSFPQNAITKLTNFDNNETGLFNANGIQFNNGVATVTSNGFYLVNFGTILALSLSGGPYAVNSFIELDRNGVKTRYCEATSDKIQSGFDGSIVGTPLFLELQVGDTLCANMSYSGGNSFTFRYYWSIAKLA